jgi:hypothetical protein
MTELTVNDCLEWESIKEEFFNSGVSLKSRTIAIQRLAKECAVGMDDAGLIVDHWREEILKPCEKFTIGDALNTAKETLP